MRAASERRVVGSINRLSARDIDEKHKTGWLASAQTRLPNHNICILMFMHSLRDNCCCCMQMQANRSAQLRLDLLRYWLLKKETCSHTDWLPPEETADNREVYRSRRDVGRFQDGRPQSGEASTSSSQVARHTRVRSDKQCAEVSPRSRSGCEQTTKCLRP